MRSFLVPLRFVSQLLFLVRQKSSPSPARITSTAWWLLKHRLTTEPVTEDDHWLWPWYAYGRSDTRYLSKNDMSWAISTMDASVGLVELAVVLLHRKGYSILATWVAILLCSNLAWGQFLYYVYELYPHGNGAFEHIRDPDGFYGNFLKYGVLNIWYGVIRISPHIAPGLFDISRIPPPHVSFHHRWIVNYPLAMAGFMWQLADLHQRRGVELYVQQQEAGVSGGSNSIRVPGKNFADECGLWAPVNPGTDEFQSEKQASESRGWVRRLAWAMFFLPWVILIVDMIQYNVRYD